MCFFSIIIPTHNVEKYVKGCLDSVLGQSFSDFEIVIIDDQSTDSTYGILEDYSDHEDRIHLECISHQGVGGARNRAISIAKGEYLIFVDADDKIDSFLLEKLYECISVQKSDICYLPTHYLDTETGIIRNELIKNLDEENYYFDSIDSFISFVVSKGGIVPGSMWTQVFRREFVVSNKILFDPQYIWSEDGDFCFNALMKADKISLCSYGGYIWNRTNVASSTSNISDDKIISRLTVYCKWYRLYNQKQFDNLSSENSMFLSKYFLRNYCEVLKTYVFIKKHKERTNVENVFKQQNVLFAEPSYVPIEFRRLGLKTGRVLYLCRFYIFKVMNKIKGSFFHNQED